MRTILKVSVLLALAAVLAPAQTALPYTTLAAALTADERELVVASATGIAGPSGSATTTVLYIDREAMRVTGVSGTRISVIRGQDGGMVTPHASGARVWFGPASGAFGLYAPSGACTATAERYLPRVVIPTGQVFDCDRSSGVWMELAPGGVSGTVETGVTAIETGTAGHRITKLTFSGLALGAPTEAAALAFGKKLYTLPTGAVIVKAAHMNVALTGSGATCDADTPDVGLGTTIGSGASATLNLVDSGAGENILTGQTANDVNGTAEVKTVENQVLTIESAGSHAVHLNVADSWAGACSVTGTGSVVVEWTRLN